MKLPRPLLPAALVLACATPLGHAATIDFEDVAMPNEQPYTGGGRFWSGLEPPPSGQVTSAFVSGAATFSNINNDCGVDCSFWSGFAYSNTTDTTTPGSINQYSAWPGSGAGGSANYAVAYADGFNPAPRIAFGAPTALAGVHVANTTYAALFMYDGDNVFMQPPFGGSDGDTPDYLLLTITGLDAADSATGTVEYYLADFRDPDDANDYILDSWAFVALGSLGVVSALEFSLSSSSFFTPTYVALDDFQLVPLPAAAWLLAPALGLLLTRRRRC